MELLAQLVIQQMATSFMPPQTYASHPLRVIHLVPLVQHPSSQLNADLVSTHTNFKELFASNPATQDIMPTPTVCVSNVLPLAKSARVHLLSAQPANLSIICLQTLVFRLAQLELMLMKLLNLV